MFIAALSATGTVDSAARSVGMTRMAAYNLRKREGAESFGQAWDLAIDSGRARVFDYAMDRALNGVTTLRLRLGGTIDISHGPDKALITTMLKSPLPGSHPCPYASSPSIAYGAGAHGVEEQSRAPLSSPNATPQPTLDLILAEHSRDGWGAHKILKRRQSP